METQKAEAFSGKDKCPPEQQLIHELEEEKFRMRMKREILKNGRVLYQGTCMRYGFIDE